ncbi:MAG: antibiotic biosynthesis monooxygenase [Actinomycetota bacterium]|nr:antibiotic biosynthesis monooxygenase [Actinomycetota bacterium]
MSQVGVIARIPVQPGKRHEVVAAMDILIDSANGEVGTQFYVLHEDQKDPDVLWVYELYADADALDTHMNADAMKSFIGAAGGLMAGRAELTMLTPISGKGL